MATGANGDREEDREIPPHDRWRHARAAFVLFHFAAVLLLSVPASSAMRDISAWRAPHAQRDLAAWAARANALGIDVTQPEFERALWDFAGSYLETRAIVIRPFALYAHYSGALQGWSMFASPQTEPVWLTIDVTDGEAYRTVYRERSAEHAWMRRELDHNRVRKLEGRLGRGAYDDHYRGLVEWLAVRAARDFPDAVRLRARVERRRTPEPFDDAETDYLDARWERELVVDLGALR
ncbi:MAG: hypothetical protein DRJ42_10480 [Deltaproteobacteria bacterium]|nr:MAG: hypothetical protein DRJ42_10480 [Deltaproteobacteria bacterium]